MVVAIKKRSLSSSGQQTKTPLPTSDILERIRAVSLAGNQNGSWKDDSQASLGSLLTVTTSASSSSCGNVLPRTRQDLLLVAREEAHAHRTETKLTSAKYEKLNKTATSKASLPLFDICQNTDEETAGELSRYSPRSSKNDDSSLRVPSSLLRQSRYGSKTITTKVDLQSPVSSFSSQCSGGSYSSSSSSSSSSRDDRICRLRRRIRHHQRRMSTLTDCRSLSDGHEHDNCDELSVDSFCSARSAPGRIKAAPSVTAQPLPLPLTTPVSPAPKKRGPYEVLVTNITFYTFAVSLVVLTALNKYHTSSLAQHLNAARTHTLSAQHHLTTATLELRTYDEYLHSLESIGASLRSDLDALATNVDTRSRRLTVEDTKIMNDHENFVEHMKMKERSRRETMENLKSRVQEAARTATVDKYGHGINNKYRVDVTVQLSTDADEASYIIETASVDHAPHTVHHFMEQIDNGLWNDRKLAFTSNPGHLLRATPTTEGVAKEFKAKGLDRLIVDESPNAAGATLKKSGGQNNHDDKAYPQHQAYTVAFPSSHIGAKSSEIGFYIDTQDNTDGIHDNDAIFGTIISGREVIDQITARSGSHVQIIKAKIL